MITLVLADDHAMLREGLRRKFEDIREFRVAGEAGSAAELEVLLRKHPPDVLLLDNKLPDANGTALIPKIKQQAPRTRVIVLTMYNHVRYAVHALESGADGFMVKGAPFEELVQSVRAVHAGRTYVCTELASQLMGRFRRPHASQSIDALSPREFEVFTMLSSGMSMKEIADRMGINEKTIATYRTRLMEKLNLDTNTDLVRFALESGLVE